MTTRKQAQLARVLKEAVSDAVLNRLNDPRIEGFVSVTRVEMSENLREANVFFSIFGSDEAVSNKTYAAIEHSKSRIQSLAARRIHRRFCPTLYFYRDQQFKKTLETMNLIDKAVSNLKDKEDIGEQ